MNNNAVWICALGLLLLLSACNNNRVDLAKRENIALGDAESAQIVIDMGVGQLDLNGGADDLLAAEFRYNVESWEPEVEYEVEGNIGQLSVSKPDNGFEGIVGDNAHYEWDLRLNDDIPTNLAVNLGIGQTALNLSGLTLTDLNIDTGVGMVTVDLSGDWSQSFGVTISGGVGRATVILPHEVGVLVEMGTGIGSLNVDGLIRDGNTYTNEAFGESDVTITIDVGGGIGDIDLELEN